VNLPHEKDLIPKRQFSIVAEEAAFIAPIDEES
jgi:hypothetical protein